MKKIFLLWVVFIAALNGFSQTLFTYGNRSVSKEEFVRAFNKNNTGNDRTEKALREYVELYSKFKLKVAEAQLLKLDTVEQLQADLLNFRSQVEEGYLNDEAGIQKMTDEAFARAQKDIRVTHFYVPVNPGMGIQDSASAYNAINDFYKELQKGNSDYKSITGDLSMKYHMIVKSADIGFISVFSIPYEYENIMYGLKVGSFSKPYRSKNAWHIFMNTGERKPFGKWKAAQILFLLPPNFTPEQQKAIQQKADSVYNKLISGDDFIEMVKKYSDDRFTYQTGGEMKEFGVGKFSPAFEDEVAKLKNDGDISKPIFTGDGYHIVKRLHQTPVVSDKNDETNIYALKQQVLTDARVNITKQKFIKDVLQMIGFRKNQSVDEGKMIDYADSVVHLDKNVSTPFDSVDIFYVGKNVAIQGDKWYAFVKQKRQPLSPKTQSNEDLYKDFISMTALDYYRKNLEEYNSDFKYQMQEFSDGNMLFEIMERKVWAKASNDTAGLLKHYLNNKEKYLWKPSADVIIFNCSNKETAGKAIQQLKEGKKWLLIAEESNATIQADSGRYEITQLQIPAEDKLTEDYISPVSVNDQDNTASFVQVLKLYPADQQRSFEEAKGLVINDYQNYLEEKWIEELKVKYPVTVNEKVFKSLLK